MFLRQPEPTGRVAPEIGGKLAVASSMGDDGGTARHPHGRIGYRFGAEGMLLAGLESEHIAGQVERADLATPILHHLVGADRARYDLIEILGWFRLAVDFGVSGK